MPTLQQSAQLAQTQVLSPQMRQSLEILQATALELQHMVRQELETNPVLEEERPRGGGGERRRRRSGREGRR